MQYFYIACSAASLVAFIGFVLDRASTGASGTSLYIGAFIVVTAVFWAWFFFVPENPARKAIEQRALRVTSYTDGQHASDSVEGTFSVGLQTWAATVLLPPFKQPPTITITHPEGRGSATPTVSEVTTDKFTVTIDRSDLAGEWRWRARGVLLRKLE